MCARPALLMYRHPAVPFLQTRGVAAPAGIARSTSPELLLQPLAKVESAYQRVEKRRDDEADGDNGKRGQGHLDGTVVKLPIIGEEPCQFEDEVDQCPEIEKHGRYHTQFLFIVRGIPSSEENGNRDGDRGDGETKFRIPLLRDDANELDQESNHEEEVELQQGDIDQVIDVALLHRVVGADQLEDRPGKLLIDLPSAERHEDRGQCHDARDGNEERLGVAQQRGRGLTLSKGARALHNLQ